MRKVENFVTVVTLLWKKQNLGEHLHFANWARNPSSTVIFEWNQRTREELKDHRGIEGSERNQRTREELKDKRGIEVAL